MAGDANYNSVSLLLHGNGSDGSTTVTDNSPSPKTVTAVGNARIRTAQSKFGGSSLYCDGSGDYFSLTGVSFGTGVLTVEGWLYVVETGKTNTLIDTRNADITTSGFLLYVRSTTNKLTVGTGSPFVATEGSTTVTTGWHHIALVRTGGNFYTYLDGVLEATVANSATLSNTSWRIGNTWDASANGEVYIDDLRVTSGVARYTSNFTPPARAFPDGLGEVEGVVRDSAAALCSRTVRAYRRDTGALAGSAVSDATTGAYRIGTPTLDEVSVIALDNATSGTYYNDQVIRVIPT